MAETALYIAFEHIAQVKPLACKFTFCTCALALIVQQQINNKNIFFMY
jgi:hypothetical protein